MLLPATKPEPFDFSLLRTFIRQPYKQGASQPKIRLYPARAMSLTPSPAYSVACRFYIILTLWYAVRKASGSILAEARKSHLFLRMQTKNRTGTPYRKPVRFLSSLIGMLGMALAPPFTANYKNLFLSRLISFCPSCRTSSCRKPCSWPLPVQRVQLQLPSVLRLLRQQVLP